MNAKYLTHLSANDMNTTRETLCLSVMLMAACALQNVQAGPGEDVVNSLNARYAKTGADCGSQSKPAVLCYGVIIRATATPEFWVPQEKNIKSGALSFSYLRKDAKFKNLAYQRNNGFTLYPILSNPKQNKDYHVLCAFPKDANTDRRQDQGCTDNSGTAQVEKYCHELKIDTARQWVDAYKAEGYVYSKMCGFNIRDERNELAAPAFQAFIEARKLAGEKLFTVQNELRIATWANNPPLEPPVESTFYTNPPSSESPGLENGRANQIAWWKATGQYLPLVKLELPQVSSADAKFSYQAADQAIQPTTAASACKPFFDSVTWTDVPASAAGPAHKSLVVVPSACGRAIKDEQTNNFVNELVALHYLNPAWQGATTSNPDTVLSMRRQVTCYFTYYRNEPQWTLEPHRPLVDIKTSGAKRCDA
ncbi:DUF2599 domain-containing protein [Pseudomonas wadenswilerensis]